jgi:hypothetical protein
MQSLRSRIRRPLHIGLALLVVAASLHCAWEWQAALKQMAAATAHSQARLPLPIGWPIPGCENESGCICRGATLAQAVDTADLRGIASDWLRTTADLAIVIQPRDAIGNGLSPPRDLLCFAPPISGRQLRALYGSLVI